MTPSRPYLLRALYEWISDNGMTPYLLVDALQDGVEVPQEYVENGKIVLNIGMGAVQSIDLGNEALMLDARFSGKPMQVVVPIEAVMAIYARENGKGMVFTEEDGSGDKPPTSDKPSPSGTSKSKKPQLRVIK
jgi:stringent starvation protein B